MEILTSISSIEAKIHAYRTRTWNHDSADIHQHTDHSQAHDQPKLVGFVPTMGYVHEGHMSLIQQAKMQCDFVIMSIFVNPLQFAPHEDYDHYPRDHERDCAFAEAAGVDVVFLPDRHMMYPQPTQTLVRVSGLTETCEGTSRPGHFDGVATVVLKLFHIVKPDKAYFGLKDAQQVAMIQQMVYDLNMHIDIVACPTWREADGLAMSSRNVYLNPEQRAQAVVLSQALKLLEHYMENMQNPQPEELIRIATKQINSAPLAHIDYIHVAAYPSFQTLNPNHNTCIIALAVFFGQTRLIDNLIIPIRR